MSARTADEKAKIKALRQEASSLKALFTSWPFLVKLGTLAVGWVIFFGESCALIINACTCIPPICYADVEVVQNAPAERICIAACLSVQLQHVGAL
jgi:hypothetical protein